MSKNIFKTVIAAFVAVAMCAMFSLSAFAVSPAKDLNGKVYSYSYASAHGAEEVCCEDGGPHCNTNTVTNTKSSEVAIKNAKTRKAAYDSMMNVAPLTVLF